MDQIVQPSRATNSPNRAAGKPSRPASYSIEADGYWLHRKPSKSLSGEIMRDCIVF